MKKIHVAFAVNDNYVEYLGVALYSLLKNNTTCSFAVSVLSSDLSKDSKQTILLLKKKFKNVSIDFITPDKKLFDRLPITIEHISKETYYRYVLADVLPTTEKVLYLDVDLLVRGDITALWNTDLGDNDMAGAKDSYVAKDAAEFYDSRKYTGYKQSIGFGELDPYVNAGVLLFNLDKIRQDGLVSVLLANTENLKDKINFQDQDIINITFKGKIAVFSNDFNFTSRDMIDDPENRSAKVVHFTGASKPWCKDRHAPDTARYYNGVYLQYLDEYRRLIHTLLVNGKENVKYGLFSYNTDNIGDEIQSIAARRFLPRVDYYVDRDTIDALKTNVHDKVKIIMNGWYSHKPDMFPPDNPNIDPLLISMYIADHVKEQFASDRSRYFMNKFGPVGARNTDTKEYFDEIGVESYFSGCLTLTLQKTPAIKKCDFILAVDVPKKALAILKKTSQLPVLEMGAFITTEDMTVEERFALAELYLYLYQSARAVVTTRLHATLPCLALETPVLNLEKENFEPGRFAGLRELAHHMTVEEFVGGLGSYDINKPPKNPSEYLKVRAKLIEKCRDFTGYVNNDGFLSQESDSLLSSVATLQPLMNGLTGNYERDYVKKVLEDRVDMVNSAVFEANATQALKEELATTREQLNDVLTSRAWKWASKAQRTKSKLSDLKDKLS